MISDYKVVVFDGGAATGKDTLARHTAEYLGYRYIDSGKLYRLIAYFAKLGEYNYQDDDSLKSFLDNLVVDFTNTQIGYPRISYYFRNGQDHNWNDATDILNDENVLPELSVIAQIPAIRSYANRRWIFEAKKSNIVFSGRAMLVQTFAGHNIAKAFFITCDPTQSGKRRWQDLQKEYPDISLEEVLTKVLDRNKKDQNHLTLDPRMIIIDNSGPLQETLEKIYAEVEGLL